MNGQVAVKVCLVVLMGVMLAACHHTTKHQQPVKKQAVPTRSNNITAINPKAYTKAYQHFSQLAQSGDAVAQFNLARMYEDGRGVNVDEGQAIKWFQQAASNGNTDAEVSLGAVYLFAQGTPKNSRTACKLFKQASKKGDRAGRDFFKHYCA